MDIGDVGSSSNSSKISSGYNLIRQCVKEQRPTLDKIWQNIFTDEIPLYNGNLVEISSSENCSRSYLLYKLMAYAATVMNYCESSKCEIIFIDFMYKFDIELFISDILKPILKEMQIKQKKIATDAKETDAEKTEANAEADGDADGDADADAKEENDIIDNILESITICDCYSSDELEIALNEIERNAWHNSNIALIIIDGILDDLYDSPLNALAKLQTIGQNLNVCCMYAKRFHNFNDESTDLGHLYLRDCHDLSIISERSFPFAFNDCLPFLLKDNVENKS